MSAPEDDFADLVDRSIAEILRHEDHSRYLQWLRAHADELLSWLVQAGPAERSQAAWPVGRAIWNAVPLPSNRFTPRPVAEPGRNDACPCGSGRKYKQCCAHLPPMPAPPAAMVWSMLLAHLGRAQLEAAVASHRVPPEAFGDVALRYLEAGQAQKAVRLLEPLFDGAAERLDERFEHAFDVLIDAWQALGHDRKRLDFARRIGEHARGALQRAAWQRVTAMLHDRGDLEAAWMRCAVRSGPTRAIRRLP
jgi:hypothetical protein